MKKFWILSSLFITLTTMAQTTEKNPKDLWTHSVEVSMGDNWRQTTITVPGKEVPNVLDFFRAFAQAYPCEYHDLLLMAIDGDKEVLFRHERPYIEIDEDTCFLENESFSMRVFYENDEPAALGVRCHKALTTKLQDAYYYRYDKATRKLSPMAQGSDFTGGIVKRETSFVSYKNDNAAVLRHGWGRCELESRLVWSNGKFELQDPTKKNLKLHFGKKSPQSVLEEVIDKHQMEMRDPKPEADQDGTRVCGGSYNSLPICIAIRDPKSATNHYVTASAMEGYYYFTARSWERADGNLLVAVYTECASRFDYYKNKNENGEYITTPHKLEAGDEVDLNFYICNDAGMALYMDPASPQFATLVGKGLPSLEGNEWRCVLLPDSDDLVFVSETDGRQMVFKWDGKTFKAQ